MAIGYKVVWTNDIQPGGWSVSNISSGVGDVYYKIGETTGPKKGFGPLCVFETLKDAKKFYKSVGRVSHTLYECEYKPSRCKTVWYVYYGKRVHNQGLLYKGTKLAKSVKLIRKVKV
jgi:hypothetical protein